MENIVRKLRGKRTQKEFAELVGVAQSTIATYETIRSTKLDILEEIARKTGYRIIITIEKIGKEETSNE